MDAEIPQGNVQSNRDDRNSAKLPDIIQEIVVCISFIAFVYFGLMTTIAFLVTVFDSGSVKGADTNSFIQASLIMLASAGFMWIGTPRDKIWDLYKKAILTTLVLLSLLVMLLFAFVDTYN
jgi:hypothetical protein